MRKAMLLLFAAGLIATPGEERAITPTVMSVCQIASRAADYDGHEVAAKGIYWRTVHGAVLSASECRDQKVNIRLNAKFKAGKKDLRTLGRLANGQQAADVVFRGVFRLARQGQCFGQDCRPFQIDADELLEVHQRHQGE
jgi:hypothetical protein